MPLVGATSLGWRGTALPQVFQDLSSMGGKCIELNSRAGIHGDLVLDSSTLPQVRQWAADAGIAITSVAGYNDFAQPDPSSLRGEIDRLLGVCRIASELEVGMVRAFVGDIKLAIDLETVRPGIVEAFREVARQAETLGVELAVENHGRLVTEGGKLAELVTDIGAANVGFMADTGNFCWAGHDLAQFEADWNAVLPYVLGVHVKDGVWGSNGFEFVPAGDGELRIADRLKALTDRGYSGPVYSEYEGAGDFRSATRRSIAFLNEVMSS